jgi:hypothetical protein
MVRWRSGESLDDDERETLRRALLVALTRLHQANAGDLIAEELALRSALRSVPLLPLTTGGMLSADDAVHAHPDEHLRFLVEAVLLDAGAPDAAVALMMLATAAVGALNAALETVTDEEERALLVALARHARTIDARQGSDDNAADVIR